MASAPIAGIDPATQKLYADLLPAGYTDTAAVNALIAAALAGWTGGSSVSLANTPLEHRAVSGVYPGRPVTDRPVWWVTASVLPPAAGSTTSGTGPVVDVDSVFLAPGVGALT